MCLSIAIILRRCLENSGQNRPHQHWCDVIAFCLFIIIDSIIKILTWLIIHSHKHKQTRKLVSNISIYYLAHIRFYDIALICSHCCLDSTNLIDSASMIRRYCIVHCYSHALAKLCSKEYITLDWSKKHPQKVGSAVVRHHQCKQINRRVGYVCVRSRYVYTRYTYDKAQGMESVTCHK